MTELSIFCRERKHMVELRNVLQLVWGFAFWWQSLNSEKAFGEKNIHTDPIWTLCDGANKM